MSRTRSVPGGTPATAALQAAGIDHAMRPYEHDPRATSYGLEAAAELGVDPDRVLKTLVVSLDGRLVVGVVPVSRRLDLKALARALGGRRAAMADPAEAQRATGYVTGGISPLGQRRRLVTVIEESAMAWPTVLVSAGRRGLDVELDPQALVAATSAVTATIAR